jgi:predicted ATPase/DNA-binding XRE family transcriptional regulator
MSHVPWTPIGRGTASDMDVAEMLRDFRRRAGLSQAQLAERASMSPAAIGALEQGSRRAPYRQTIVMLANALELGPEDQAEFEAAAQQARNRGPSKLDRPTLRNLPGSLTSFIEREEIFEIETLIGKHRLVTITGSAGVGKTRSALEVARAHQRDATFVDLSMLTERSLIISELTTLLNVLPRAGVDELSTLVSALRDRGDLLVIDNCEHIIDDAAFVIEALLAKCPAIAILATSRERLNTSGEVVYRLPSLAVPPESIATTNEGRHYPALELFIARTQAADARFSFTSSDMAIAADICRDLEGIPLAIELAAARVPTLGLGTLKLRLGDSAVPRTARSLPHRHQTMLAALAWSYELLSISEKLLFNRLSVFSRGFRLDAVEAVCHSNELTRQDVAATLEALVAKSLVDVTHTDSGTRYTTLDSVRSFGAGKLVEAAEEKSTSRLHAGWVATLADSLHARKIPITFALPEIDNVRAAVHFGLNSSSEIDNATAAWIIGGCRHVWFATQRTAEIKHLAEVALDLIDEDRHVAIVAVLLGTLTSLVPSSQRAPIAERAIPLLVRTGDYVGAGALSSVLAICLWQCGRYEEAVATIEQAAAYLALHGPADRMTLLMLLNRSWIDCERENLDEARSYLVQFDKLNAKIDVDDFNILAIRTIGFATIEFAVGNFAGSSRLCQALMEDANRKSSIGREYAFASASAAICQLMLGDIDEAERFARLAFEQWDSLCLEGNERGLIETIGSIATIRNNPSFGARLMGFVDADLERDSFIRPRLQRSQNELLGSELRDRLTALEIERYKSVGRALALDDVEAELHAFFNSDSPVSKMS